MSKNSCSPTLNYFFPYALIFLAVVSTVMAQSSSSTNHGSIGVCNGRLGSNLPSEKEVVEFYKSNGFKRMRIYNPNQATLQALQDSDIELLLDVPNVDLDSLQSDATQWVQTNVRAYFPSTKIRYIAVGNEVDPDNQDTSRFAPLVLPAMQNIYRALTLFGLQDQIKVSTATFSALLIDSYPPSNTSFKSKSFMEPIVGFLSQTRAPLLANIYPYIAYVGDTENVPLSYALFRANGVVVRDGTYEYQNLFDAMVDGMYWATEKLGGANVEIVVSESGWPSDGGIGASMENSNAYYRNLIGHVKRGTPKRPGRPVETYLFAMFDEDQKPGAKSERHFGLFYPNKEMKYQVNFNDV